MLNPADRNLIESLSPEALRALWAYRIGDEMTEEEIAAAIAAMIEQRIAAEKETNNGR